MSHTKTHDNDHRNGRHAPAAVLTPTFPRLTWRQRLSCKHVFKIPVYQQVRHRDESVWLVGHVCAHCGRKLRPRRVSLLPALLCLALACLILAVWLLYMR